MINTLGIPIPDTYTSNSMIEVYINGFKVEHERLGINAMNETIYINGITVESGSTVELVVLTMSTNNLPIVETLNSSSTNEEASRS
jgi:hypothetical protein